MISEFKFLTPTKLSTAPHPHLVMVVLQLQLLHDQPVQLTWLVVVMVFVDVLSQQIPALVALGTLAAAEQVVVAALVAHVSVQRGLYAVDALAPRAPEHPLGATCKHTAHHQQSSRTE